MFGKDLNYTIIVVSAIALVTLNLFNSFYQSRKIKEYKEDERWKLIRRKVDRALVYYYELLCYVLGGFGLVVVIHQPENAKNILIPLLFFIFLKAPIEFIAIRYFDKRM